MSHVNILMAMDHCGIWAVIGLVLVIFQIMSHLIGPSGNAKKVATVENFA